MAVALALAFASIHMIARSTTIRDNALPYAVALVFVTKYYHLKLLKLQVFVSRHYCLYTDYHLCIDTTICGGQDTTVYDKTLVFGLRLAWCEWSANIGGGISL